MIYLDNNATTEIDPRVVLAMKAAPFGNPSSIHSQGRAAKAAFLQARREFLTTFAMDDLLFTSGATEAINYAIRSISKGAHLITSSLEHSAVRESVNSLTDVTVTRLSCVTVEQVLAAVTPQTRMIVLSAVNNETGIRTDIDAIAQLAYERDIAFVVDGVALLGKELFTLHKGVSAIAFSAHKIHGPMGVGCLLFRNSFKLKPMILGGMQQRGLRGGTENIAGIVGFAKALDLIDAKEIERVRAMRQYFEASLRLMGVIIHGEDSLRVSNVSNVALPGIDGETLLMKLDLAGVCASHGAACLSGALEPSYVLLNMGIARDIVRRSVRFSFSRMNREEEVEEVLEILGRSIKERHQTCLEKVF